MKLLYNTRFYILVSAVIASMAIFAGLRLLIHDDQLLAIRTQQVYGFVSVGFLYVALLISPLSRIIGKQKMQHIIFARRAIGVSAFYFALLHGTVALFGQLGGFEGVVLLPVIFQWALVFGALTFLVLGLMAATSFDALVKFMTYKKWKWLHRFVYAATILLVLHIWMIGTHLAYGWAQIVALCAIAILAALELYGPVQKLNAKLLKLGKSEEIVLFITAWAVVMALVLAIPVVVKNYHSKHTEHSTIQRYLG